MREIEPKLKALKEKHKEDKQAQAQAMMQVYKEAGMNPLASIALIFIQIPIIISLYYAVSTGGGVPLPEINLDLLYSFLDTPVYVTMNFLGLVDITEKSLWLALGAGITQYIHVKLTMPELPPRDPDAKPDMKEDFMRNMQTQMRYVMPVLIVGIAYSISAAIALYFLVSNLTTIAQEYFVRKHR
jgi:YidC/Oxa1 family membrane protein insertase